jgi:hypothetical protein
MSDIIIVEVPHSGRVMVWRAINEADLIKKASEAHDFCYQELTMEDAVVCFGDEIPDEYNDILKKDKKVIVVGWSGQTECYSLKDADTEIDAAKEAISHDLSNCFFLELNEAKDFVKSYSGHQCVELRKAFDDFIEV